MQVYWFDYGHRWKGADAVLPEDNSSWKKTMKPFVVDVDFCKAYFPKAKSLSANSRVQFRYIAREIIKLLNISDLCVCCAHKANERGVR